MVESIDLIKKKIYEIFNIKKIKIDKIILFGSRARGEATKYSDWDILIIVDDNMTFNEKRELKRLIRKTLAELLIPADIIVKNKEEIDYYKEFIGSVVREALKEGAVI